MDTRVPSRLEWLLVPPVPLSLAYLFAVRIALVRPSFVPVVVLAVLPTVYIVTVVARGLARGRATLLALAALELAWCSLAAAVVGTAIGVRPE